MANEEHVALLKKGAKVWNRWRDENPDIRPDLTAAKLSEQVLDRANLSGANLNRAYLENASLRETNLRGANLAVASLSRANLSGADLRGAHLFEVGLLEAKLCRADLRGVKMERAILLDANLSEADLSEACLDQSVLVQASLSRAKLVKTSFWLANLSWANLRGADLSGANLYEARLTHARLDRAILTDAKLWEAPREGWSIEGVICERCFWDMRGKEPSLYAPGEFERAFAEKPRIVLEYAHGLRPLDFAMLPLMVEQLQAEHPNTALHVRSVRDEGGKATVTIVVDDLGNRDPEGFQREVGELRKQLTNTQTLLLRIETERDVYREEFQALVKDMTMRGTKQITIGTVAGGHVGDISHSHDFQTGQTVIYQPNDLNQIRKLIGEIHEQREAVRGVVTAEQFADLQASLAAVRAQLDAGQPDQSLIKGALGTVRRIVEGSAANVVGGGWLEVLRGLG